ncbi:MAG: cell surface protein SprA, partial [Phaeodactylibacter sp.]|nr:cell surface protein SprA [Phaeodactylibacter sp.]
LGLLTEFNFNPLPNSFTFSTLMDRTFTETKYRFTGAAPEYTTFYNKWWTWDRNYNLNWDLAKGLKFNFNAVNLAVIDEPEGAIDTDIKRQEIWENIKGFGRNKNYAHNFTLNYTLPFKMIPFLDWINSRATYNANYTWSAAALNTQSLGNVIQNGQDRTINVDMDFVKFYNKSDYLKKINGKSRSRTISPRNGSRTPGDKKQQGQDKEEEDKKDKDKEPGIAAKVILRPLMIIRKIRVNFSENFATVVPGYLPRTEYLGLTDRFQTPGWQFVSGLQPNIRSTDYYTSNDWLYSNWQWITPDVLLNQQVTQSYSQDIDARATLEPFNDFKIEVEARRSYSNFHSEDFRRNDLISTGSDRFQEEYEHLNARDVGSYTITYFAMNTLFDDNIRAMFQTFESNRSVIADRLAIEEGIVTPHSDSAQAAQGFPLGYGRVQQSVLIPAFLAAYTGQDANQVAVNADDTKELFKTIPRPNWRLTYNGLSKLKFLKDIFQSFNITHGYKSTLTVNTFQTELLFSSNDPTRENPETGDFYSRFEIPDIVITEALSPLIGVDVKTQNGMSLRAEAKRSRNLQMSFVDNGLNETKTSEFVLGFGYRIKGFKLPFMKSVPGDDDKPLTPGSGGRSSRGGGLSSSNRNNGDLDISFDFSLRDDVTWRHLLDADVLEPTRGTRAITISPAAEYQLNKQLSLRFFFDYRRTIPKVSQSFPITNTQAGITVRFTLN